MKTLTLVVKERPPHPKSLSSTMTISVTVHKSGPYAHFTGRLSIDSLEGSLSVLMVTLTGSQAENEGEELVAPLSHSDNGGLIGMIGSTWCSEAREALCSRKDRTRLTQHSGATLHTSLQQCPTQTTTAMVLKDLDLLENLFKKHDLRYIPQKLKGNSSLSLRSLPSTSHLQRTFLYRPEDSGRGRPPSLPTLTCLSDTFYWCCL